jgi:hypothetical protein
LAIVAGHATIVTAVLLFSAAGRAYFRATSEDEGRDEPEEAERRFSRPAEAFLRMRFRKLEAKQPLNKNRQYRLMQGYWIGFALIVWGLVLELTILASPGLFLIVVCFLLHRRSVGNNRIFFRGRSSTQE